MGAICLNTFALAVDSFRAHLSARGSADNTVAAYTRDVLQLGRVLGADARPEDLNLDALRLWLRALDQRGVKPISRARKIAAVRAFCGHLARSGALASNPANNLVLPRYARALPAVLSEEAAGELLDAPCGDSVLARRDRALLELLYGCALRVSEVAALDVTDVRGGSIRVGGRGRRTIAMGRPALIALRSYLARRPELALDDAALFVGRGGARLGVRRIQHIVAGVGREAGRAVHPAMLRHSLAVHTLDRGADLISVARALGHRAIATTARYEALAINRLIGVYRAAHPLARRR